VVTQQILELYHEGLTIAQISQQVDESQSQVNQTIATST
jgi:hypothetical protein